MTTWTSDDIRAQIRASLPDGWTLSESRQEGWFHAAINDLENTPQWEDAQADVRILLFNGYGWLTMRQQKTKHPAWRPHPKQLRLPGNVQGSFGRPTIIPDPEDLDPKEIEAVYSKRRER